MSKSRESKKTEKAGKTQTSKSTSQKRETQHKSGADWEKIRLDYITSVPKKSHKAIAAEYGVSYSAVRKHAYVEKWKDSRKEHHENVNQLAGQIVDENLTEKRAKMLSEAKACGISFFLAAAQQGLVAMSDKDTFYRFDRVRTLKDDDGNFDGYEVINLVGSVFDAHGFAQLVRAMDTVMERLDNLDRTLSPIDEQRIQLMRDKFSLDKKKSGMDEGDDRAGVIVIPGQIMPELPEGHEDMTTEDFMELISEEPPQDGDGD